MTIIVAAGRGKRAGGDIPKQYQKLGQKSVLETTVSKFLPFGPVIIAINPLDLDRFQAQNFTSKVSTAFGGETRTASVRNGLAAIQGPPPDYILIHDAARPFITPKIIKNVIDKLSNCDAAAPALPIVDAVKTISGGDVNRDEILRVQTPQGFRGQKLLDAYVEFGNQSFADDIAIAKKAGLSIGFSAGCEDNIKLTYEGDFMSVKTTIRMGSGYDVHQICAGETLNLGGVEIQAGFSLKGHSDADVALHAITDAIMGAIAGGDIGDHFPPTDPQWKGASSDIFLKHAAQMVADQGGQINNIDLTIICEQPKIKPHREAMRARIADITGISIDHISVKATTTEGLGFTGRREGIAAQAICSVEVPQ